MVNDGLLIVEPLYLLLFVFPLLMSISSLLSEFVQKTCDTILPIILHSSVTGVPMFTLYWGEVICTVKLAIKYKMYN